MLVLGIAGRPPLLPHQYIDGFLHALQTMDLLRGILGNARELGLDIGYRLGALGNVGLELLESIEAGLLGFLYVLTCRFHIGLDVLEQLGNRIFGHGEVPLSSSRKRLASFASAVKAESSR